MCAVADSEDIHVQRIYVVRIILLLIDYYHNLFTIVTMIKFSHVLIEKSPFLTSFSCTVCWWAGVPVVVLASVQQLGSLRSSVASSFRLLPNECKVQKSQNVKF